MSRARCPSVMPPRLFTPRTWLPATPAMTSSTGTPATPSASSIARRTEVAAAPILAIKPLRRPFDSAAPMATNFAPVSFNSLMMAQVFVLPTSSATRYFSFLANPPLLLHHPGGLQVEPAPAACRGSERTREKHFQISFSAASAPLSHAGECAEARSGAHSASRWPRWFSLPDSPPPVARNANPPNRHSRHWLATGRCFPRADDNGCQNQNRRSEQESATCCRTLFRARRASPVNRKHR